MKVTLKGTGTKKGKFRGGNHGSWGGGKWVTQITQRRGPPCAQEEKAKGKLTMRAISICMIKPSGQWKPSRFFRDWEGPSSYVTKEKQQKRGRKGERKKVLKRSAKSRQRGMPVPIFIRLHEKEEKIGGEGEQQRGPALGLLH